MIGIYYIYLEPVWFAKITLWLIYTMRFVELLQILDLNVHVYSFHTSSPWKVHEKCAYTYAGHHVPSRNLMESGKSSICSYSNKNLGTCVGIKLPECGIVCANTALALYIQFVNHPSKIYSFAKATITRLNWIVWGNHIEKKRSSFECLLFFGVCFGILWQRLH